MVFFLLVIDITLETKQLFRRKIYIIFILPRLVVLARISLNPLFKRLVQQIYC